MARTEQVCIAGALIGAAVGAAIAYLYASDEGEQRRAGLVRLMDRAATDVTEARRAWSRLHEVWNDFDSGPSLRSRVEGGRNWPPSA